MAVFTLSGRNVLAQAILDMDLMLAVGAGDAGWDDAVGAGDAELAQLTSLTDLIGVTRIRDKSFVTPDASGTIPMTDGSLYSLSDVPTRYVYLRFQLDLADASGVTLRESGVYVGTELSSSVPSGQMYIPAADVAEIGTMMQVSRFAPIVRDGSLSQIFSTILTM